ncbi:hypothetical protein ACN469_03455 [Corallococcus terminator]
MRIESSPKSAAKAGSRPASPLSEASARTAAPKPGGRRDAPQVDQFDGRMAKGAGLPIRITGRCPPPSLGLSVKPWVPRTKLEPWTGTQTKPWIHRPDIFGTPTCPRGSPMGFGLPIRIT